MKTPQEYEQEIADRDRLIAKLRDQLTRALEAVAAARAAETKCREAA